ncbi:MAG: hypothetical protein GC146_00565 [Limimaricola sp.]|uniref:hypothetical protein n=1 Tax=Limimaricola sp. TaxID=2211665 RepID=UPI001D493B1B|nr:hypothetical protein [Limimaricola sp.]MBI1415689.1 hypothetical protein [Limimaricola sp.]
MTEIGEDQPGKAIWRSQIEDCEAQYLNGDLHAVIKGISICQKFRKPLPDWLSEAAINAFKSLINGEIRGKSGRGNKPLGSTEQRAQDIIRRNTVIGIRAWQVNRHLWTLMPEKGLTLWQEGKLDRYGATIEDAYEIAQLCLAGTKAQGSPSRMKKAYKDKSLADEHIPDWGSAVALGFLDPPGRVLRRLSAEMADFLKERLSREEKPDFESLLRIF